MPDTFLASLRGKVVFSYEHSFAISDDSVASFCTRTVDPLNPSLVRPRMGIVPFLCNLVGVSTSSPPSIVGAGTARSAGVSGSLPAPRVPLAFLLSLLLFLLLFFTLFLVLFLLLLFCLRRLPLLFILFTLLLLLFLLLLLLPFPFSSFVHSSALPTCSSCPSLPSLFASWSSFSFGSFHGLLFFLFFCLFSPFFGSSCSFLFLPFGSFVICHFFPSSFWSCFFPSCCLFKLIGSYSLLVSPFVCLVFLLCRLRFLPWFLLCSLWVTLCSFLFFVSCSSCHFCPFVFACSSCVASFLFRAHCSSSFS